jgi:hypothetical protein
MPWVTPADPPCAMHICNMLYVIRLRSSLYLVNILLGAPASLSSIMAIGPHHAAATYVGGAPKRASRSTWFGKVQLEIGLSSCALVAISRRRAKLGGVPRGMGPAGTPPPVAPHRWRPASGPVAGAGLAVFPPAASVI